MWRRGWRLSHHRVGLRVKRLKSKQAQSQNPNENVLAVKFRNPSSAIYETNATRSGYRFTCLVSTEEVRGHRHSVDLWLKRTCWRPKYRVQNFIKLIKINVSGFRFGTLTCLQFLCSEWNSSLRINPFIGHHSLYQKKLTKVGQLWSPKKICPLMCM